MKKTAALFLIVFLLIPLLCSCGSEKKAPSCLSVLEAMTGAEVGLPAGRIYSLSGSDSDDKYLSDSLIKSLYGNGSLPAVAESWLDCAIFVSALGHPCEFAVVYCSDRNSAEDTARLFSSRLNSIKALKSDDEYGNMFDKAQISICGNFVLMIVSSDPDNAFKLAKKLI